MLFENSPIEMSDLPAVEAVKFEPLEKDYLWMRLIAWGITFLILLGVAVIFGFKSDVSFWITPAAVLALCLLTFFLEIRGFSIKGYALRQHDISYKSGLLFFSMTSVPFNRIQHCEVSQGPLGRLFDLATVKVYTAGGSTSDLSIGGIKKEEAHKLRDHISKLSSQYA